MEWGAYHNIKSYASKKTRYNRTPEFFRNLAFFFIYCFMTFKQIPFRLIFSVAAGVATVAVLSVITHEVLHLLGVFPPAFKPMFNTRVLWIALTYHSLYTIIGAYVTAIVAREKARKAVMILGTKGAVIWLLGTLLLWKHSPAWFNISKALTEIPLSLLGGWFYHYYKRKKAGMVNMRP